MGDDVHVSKGGGALPLLAHISIFCLALAEEMVWPPTVADIYGLPVNTSMPDMAMRRSNATFWRSNPDLYVQRLRAAVATVQGLDYVNGDSLGLIGYCFGGSGVVFDVFSDSSLKVRDTTVCPPPRPPPPPQKKAACRHRHGAATQPFCPCP